MTHCFFCNCWRGTSKCRLGKMLILLIKSLKNQFWLLQMIHNTYGTTDDELLSININFSIYPKRQQFLVTEIFKSVRVLNPCFMSDYFIVNRFPYQSRNTRGVSVFQGSLPSSSNFQTQVDFGKVYYKYIPLSSLFASNVVLRYLNILNS